jgi:hypothetical protein
MKVENKNDWEKLINKATSGDTDAMNEVAIYYNSGLT